LPRALAKYSKLSPEAVRSLAEEEEKTMTFYDFPKAMHRSIRTTNAIESLWSLVPQRTEQIDVFTTERSCLTILWATIEGIRLRKVPVEETEG
jgi:transposase-like protein